jgi:hypothetical protein
MSGSFSSVGSRALACSPMRSQKRGTHRRSGPSAACIPAGRGSPPRRAFSAGSRQVPLRSIQDRRQRLLGFPGRDVSHDRTGAPAAHRCAERWQGFRPAHPRSGLRKCLEKGAPVAAARTRGDCWITIEQGEDVSNFHLLPILNCLLG